MTRNGLLTLLASIPHQLECNFKAALHKALPFDIFSDVSAVRVMQTLCVHLYCEISVFFQLETVKPLNTKNTFRLRSKCPSYGLIFVCGILP